MGKILERLNADLKQAMIAGDKKLVAVIKMLKSSIQYASVEEGAGNELSEQKIISVLQKESKKRRDAQELYANAGDSARADNEAYEKKVIDGYLPKMLSKEEVIKLVDEAIKKSGGLSQQNMGKIIGEVKQKSGGLAEGSQVANIVKERLTQ